MNSKSIRAAKPRRGGVSRAAGRPGVERLEGRRLLALAALPSATTNLDFSVGRSIADPVRNVVYAIDATNNKVIAVDTDLGRKVSDSALRGVGSALAVSPDGGTLFVTEPGTFKIEKFALPDLTPAGTLDVGFACYDLVAGVGGKLYAAGPGSIYNALYPIDATTGAVGAAISLDRAYYATLLRTNAAGTRVYGRSTHLSGGGGLDVFDVSVPGAVTRLPTIPSNSANGQDFVVDEAGRRVYTSDGGVYGVGVTNMDSGAIAYWPIGSYGASVATREDSPDVFGMTYDGVQRFDKATGIGLNYNGFGFLSSAIESLKMTPNGRVTYTGGRSFSLIGGPSTLVIDGVPTARIVATTAADGSFAFDAGGSTAYLAAESITQYRWDFDDGSASVLGASWITGKRFATPGAHQVTLTVTASTGLTDQYVLNVNQAAATPAAPANVGFDNYAVNEGGSTTLYGFAYPLAAGQTIVKWEYDFIYDGLNFDVDAIGQRPTFLAGDGPASRAIGIRVTDNFGQVVTRTQSIRIDNVAPTATFAATAAANTITASFSGATDVSVADRAAGFLYSFDFNYDGDFNDPGDVYRSASPSASYAFATSGTYKVGGRVEDKDGGYTDYSAFATVAANPNLAAGKPTDASATAAGSSPANATDLDLASAWVAATSGDAWLRVDLGGFYNVSSIVASFGAAGIPSSFAIQTSADGVSYSNVASYSGNTSSSKTVSGPATAVRYVRLNFYGAAAPYRVTDLRVYGTAIATPPPVPSFTYAQPKEGGAGTTYLVGSATLAAGQSIVKWEYDFSYDGVFYADSSTSQQVYYAYDNSDGPTSRQVAIRVTDNYGQVATAVQTITVENVAPTATLAVVANADGSATATFSGATDPGVADRAAGFRYAFDFNNDGDFADAGEVSNATSPTATYAFAASGTYAIRGRISDKDGGFTDYTKSVTVTVPTTGTTPTRLTGTGIGTAGSFASSGNTFAKALDDNLASYFDAPSGNGNWVGLDLGSAKTIAQVGYAPRGGWAGRMVGGVFQGANDATFAGGVTLATISTKPAEGAITTLGVTNGTAFRYVRYLSPNGSYGNVAEVQFFTGGGTTTPPPTPPPPTPSGQLTGTLIGTSGSFGNGGNTIAKAVDNNLASYFDGPSGDNQWVGLDLGSAGTVTSVSFAPRGGWEGRMVGGVFQGSNDATFATGVATLATITAKPTAGTLTSLTVTGASAYRYVRYLAPKGSYGNVAELKFFGSTGGTTTPPPTPPPTTATLLTGSYIGTAGSFAGSGNVGAKLFDGSVSSFFDAPTSSGAWAGLDVGTARTITSIQYAPRGGWAGRMVGGMFQASNDATFATGVVTLATITAKPTEGVLTSVAVTAGGSYRYVRYLGPAGGYCNASEVQFFG